MKESFGVPLWIFRRNESDIINCYNFLTPFVVRATGGGALAIGARKPSIPMRLKLIFARLLESLLNSSRQKIL